MVDSIQAPSTAQVHTELGTGTMDAASAGFWHSAHTLLLASKRYSEEFWTDYPEFPSLTHARTANMTKEIIAWSGELAPKLKRFNWLLHSSFSLLVQWKHDTNTSWD